MTDASTVHVKPSTPCMQHVVPQDEAWCLLWFALFNTFITFSNSAAALMQNVKPE